MRVQEADPSALYKMGKNRKHRIQKAKENEADDSSEDGVGCPHVTKAVNLAAMRKAVQKPTVTLGECSGCIKDGPKTSSRDLFGGVIEGVVPAEGDDTESAETTICICLQCGHQGCDRNSHYKHALKHYKTPHSNMHSIVVNLTTWSTWCYICDEEVLPNPRIQGCIDFLQKQSGILRPDPVHFPAWPAEREVAEAAPALVNTPAGKHSSPVSCVKVKGLSNLGNTCFFNAVMQSLCQTRGLEALLIERSKPGRLYTIPGMDSYLETDSGSSDEEREETFSKHVKLPSIQVVDGDPGAVTLALLSFLQEMRGGTSRNGIVNPIALFTQVCKKAPRFKGFQQQDSHELLRYLIDCVRTEEIKRGQAAILKFFKLPESINPKKVDEETKFRVKEYGRQVKHTFLDGLFGGHLVSTVRCEECKNVSQIFEAFLDLSLPVTEEKPQRPNLILIGKKKDFVNVAETTEDGDDMVAASSTGLDLSAEKPSKTQERKNKRMAKKDAKRKNKLQKSRSTEHQDQARKGDLEENAGLDHDAASEDSNKNDNENCSSKDDLTPSPLDAGSKDVGDRRPQVSGQDSGRSSRAADSSPEGSKDDLGGSGDKERDDPSDADIEDNIESDLSRLHQSSNSTHPLTESPGDLSQNLTVDLSAASVESDILAANVISDPVVASVSSNPQIAEINVGTSVSSTTAAHISKKTSPGDAAKVLPTNIESTPHRGHESSTVINYSQPTSPSLPHSKSSCSAAIMNGDVHELSPDRVLNKGDNCISQLCVGVKNLGLSFANAGDRAYISSGLSIDKSQVIHLSNGFSRLTVNNDDNTCSQMPSLTSDVSCTIAIDTLCERNKFHINKPNCEESMVTSQCSGSLEIRCGTDEVHGLGGVSQMDHKTRENERGEVDAQVSGMDEQLNILKTRQEFLREARNCSMSTLSPRYHPAPKECSILSCLNQFTAAELLTGTNKFGCRECTKKRRKNSLPAKSDKKVKDTVYSNANKQYLIFRPPAVLTLHLKRFEQTGLTSRKVNRHVDFPLLLDLAPYCSSLCQGVKEGQTKVLYSLYGVVEHSGRLSGGHYTAYIKVRPGLSPHTHFMHNYPPAAVDLLNVFLTRVVKPKEGIASWHEGVCDRLEGGDIVDKDIEARAEALLPPGRWFHISDSRVNEVAEAEVLKAQAYLLFYERIF